MPLEQLYPDLYEHDELTLRCFNMDDADELSDAMNKSYEELRPWISWAKPVLSIGEAESLCIKFEDAFRGGKDFALGVFDSRMLLGYAALHPVGNYPDDLDAEIGLWVRTSHAGRGFGSRIVEGLLDWGFREWEWERISLKCDPDNRALVRVAEKVGLDLTETVAGGITDVDGRQKDALVYTIAKLDWKYST